MISTYHLAPGMQKNWFDDETRATGTPLPGI